MLQTHFSAKIYQLTLGGQVASLIGGHFNQCVQYEYMVYNSAVESDLAREFEKNSKIKVYAKLPGWFKTDTSLGNYNADWAILFEKNNDEKLYCVIESTGTPGVEFLRRAERVKIDCGKKHFEELSRQTGQEIKKIVARDMQDVVDGVFLE